jgi:predicted amidohydrolase
VIILAINQTGMKICVAQTRPVKGDIQANIEAHLKFAQHSATKGADVIIFPELSLTGYEPALAQSLAIELNDHRLGEFQKLSDATRTTIAVGAPTKNKRGTSISLIIFQPDQPRKAFSKYYLHSDEEPFFVPGENIPLDVKGTRLALAICYEISIPEHTQQAFRDGAGIYIASVAKFANGIDKAIDTISETARKYSAIALMSNCVGECDGALCVGKSSVWNQEGHLLGQLNDTEEGMLMLDTTSLKVTTETLMVQA